MNLKDQIARNLIVKIDTSKVMTDGPMELDWIYDHNLGRSNMKRYIIKAKVWLSEKEEYINKIAEMVEEDENN